MTEEFQDLSNEPPPAPIEDNVGTRKPLLSGRGIKAMQGETGDSPPASPATDAAEPVVDNAESVQAGQPAKPATSFDPLPFPTAGLSRRAIRGIQGPNDPSEG